MCSGSEVKAAGLYQTGKDGTGKDQLPLVKGKKTRENASPEGQRTREGLHESGRVPGGEQESRMTLF